MNAWKGRTMFVIGFIIIAILAVLVYDAVAIHFGGTEASISSIIINASYKMPFMVFCISFPLGVLCGHLFWRMKGNKDTASNKLDTSELS